MISIILIEPEYSANIGAVSRVMANFDFNNLIIIHPKCEISEESKIISKHSKNILENAKIIKNYDLKILNEFDLVVGTTAKTIEIGNINRNAVSLKQFSKDLKKLSKNTDVAIVFGREGDGLFNNEIDLCDYLITVPSSKNYRALNLSHAVCIVCYEIFNDKNSKTMYKLISRIEKDVLFDYFYSLTKKLDYSQNQRKTTDIVLKKVLNKANLSVKEYSFFMEFLRKIDLKLKKTD